MTNTHRDDERSGSVSSGDALRAATRFLSALRYRKKWFALIALCVFAAGGFHYLTAQRIYEATAQLLIDESQLRNAGTATDGGSQRAKLPTYERLITSDTVLKAALEDLEANSPESLADLGSSKDRWIAEMRKLTTARAARNTNIIELSYRSGDSGRAEIVLAAVMDSFLEFIRKLHQDNSVAALEVLNEERRDIEADIAENQGKLVSLRTKVGAVGFDDRMGDTHPNVQRALKLNENLTDVRKQRVELQAQLAAVRVAIEQRKDLREHLYAVDKEAAQGLISSALGLSPQAAQRVAVEEQKLMEDLTRLRTVAQHYGPTHPERIELESAIQSRQAYLAQYQSNVNQRLGNIQDEQLAPILLSMVEEKLNKALVHEKVLADEYHVAEQDVAAMNSSLAEWMLAQRNLERLNRSYDMLVEKIQGIDLGHNQADVRVSAIGEPKAGSWPVSPRLKLIFVSCMLLSVGLGSAVIYLLDMLDDRFRAPEELERQAAAPVLSVVRRLAKFEGTGAQALQVYREPRASNSEAFRTLRTALNIANPDCQCFAITSSEPGDGKTTVTSNLAASIAQSGRRILLIDADLRKPGLTKLFDLRQAPGLTQLLREPDMIGAVDRYLFKCEIANLHLIPCGPKPIDPAELLSSREFSDLVAWGTQAYDQVLIDCPPMLVANDAAVVSRITEGLVLVVQPQKNSRRLVLRAVDRIRTVGSNLLGVVVNFAAEGREDSYYGYSDHYGYGYGYGYGADSDHPTDDDSKVAAASHPLEEEPAIAAPDVEWPAPMATPPPAPVVTATAVTSPITPRKAVPRRAA